MSETLDHQDPSVASLRRIADAMKERVASFFVGEPPGCLTGRGHVPKKFQGACRIVVPPFEA